MAPTITGFQGIKSCIKYMDSHPHKPIFSTSNSHDDSNVIILTWSGNQVEDYTTHNFLEFHQYVDHAIIINIRQSVSGIIHTILGVAVYWKVQIQLAIASDSTDGKIYACTSLSIKLSLCGDIWKPYNSTLVHQKHIWNTTKVIFLLLKLKELLIELNTLKLL